MNHRCKCIIISPWTCDTWITCVCVRVCVWARRRWKKWRTSWWLGQLHVEEAYGGLSTLMFIFMFVLFARVCMKNTSTAWPVLSPVDKRWSSKYTPLTLQPPFPPLLVYLLLWLPGHFPTCPANTNRLPSCGLGVHLLSFGVSFSGWTRTSLEYFHSLYGCWVSHTFLSLRFDSDKITKWPAPLHFLAVL